MAKYIVTPINPYYLIYVGSHYYYIIYSYSVCTISIHIEPCLAEALLCIYRHMIFCYIDILSRWVTYMDGMPMCYGQYAVYLGGLIYSVGWKELYLGKIL